MHVLDQLDSNLQYYLGLGYVRLGKLDRAIKAFDEGITFKENKGTVRSDEVKLVVSSS